MLSSAFKISKPTPPKLFPTSIFNESRLKLYRARVHAHEVSCVWESWVHIHNDPVQRRKFNPDYGRDGSVFIIGIPWDATLALGDSIRCLRSALDYLVASMARAKGISDKSVSFPFHRECSGIKGNFTGKAGKGRQADFRKLSAEYPDLETVIIKEIQPFSKDDGAGPMGDSIWRLITSDNIDKHRLMTPTVQSVSIGKTRMSNGATFSDMMVTGDIFRSDPGTVVEYDEGTTIDMFFEEPARIAGLKVTRSLAECGDFVADIIEIFEEKFSPRN